jgi:hypothetical protein
MAGKIKVDLHNHLGRFGNFSSFDRVANIASNRLGKYGILGICNCDDKRFEKFIDFRKGKYNRLKLNSEGIVYVPEVRLLIIKDQEIFSDQGHFLAVGLQKNKNVISKKLEDSLKEAVDSGLIIGTVHRYYKSGLGMYLEKHAELEGYFDFDEIFNAGAELSIPGLFPAGANEKARRNYEENMQGKIFVNPYTGEQHLIGAASFTDGHSERIIGKSYTLIKPLGELEDYKGFAPILESLRRNLREVQSLDSLHRKGTKLASLKHVAEVKILNKVFPIRQ